MATSPTKRQRADRPVAYPLVSCQLASIHWFGQPLGWIHPLTALPTTLSLPRLVALVPHPREHRWTYFGVLAPASPLRDAVVRQASHEGTSPGHPCGTTSLPQ